MPLTPAIIERLQAAGIVDPAHSRWERKRAIFDEVMFSCGWVCWCLGYPVRREGVPVEHNGRRILICQCEHCHLITWAYWLGKGKWTGGDRVSTSEIAPRLSSLPWQKMI